MEDNAKKVFLSVLGVAILLVAVIGVSFAAFNYVGGSETANSISTGTITMSYSEAVAGIFLDDALPMTDEAGLAPDAPGPRNSFEFTVTTSVSGDKAIAVPYVISVTNASEQPDVLTDGQVKIALLDGEGNQVVSPRLVSALSASATRPGSLVLYDTAAANNVNNVSGGDTGKVVDTYVLKLWIDENVDAAFAKELNYKLYVNVDSNVAALGK